MLRNRHPADALADVRAEIKQLQIQEAELRNELLQADADRRGLEWEAWVWNCNQERLNIKAVKEHFGDAIKPFLRPSKIQNVRLRRAQKPGQNRRKTVDRGIVAAVAEKTMPR
jgi:hypothetical protein